LLQIKKWRVMVSHCHKKLNKYRCTRNKPYAHDCIGHDNLGARQGHYIEAPCALNAYGKMCADYPEEVDDGFTVELCNEWALEPIEFVEKSK